MPIERIKDELYLVLSARRLTSRQLSSPCTIPFARDRHRSNADSRATSGPAKPKPTIRASACGLIACSPHVEARRQQLARPDAWAMPAGSGSTAAQATVEHLPEYGAGIVASNRAFRLFPQTCRYQPPNSSSPASPDSATVTYWRARTDTRCVGICSESPNSSSYIDRQLRNDIPRRFRIDIEFGMQGAEMRGNLAGLGRLIEGVFPEADGEGANRLARFPGPASARRWWTESIPPDKNAPSGTSDRH